MDNIFPMNTPAAGQVPGQVTYVYVLIVNGVVGMVSTSISTVEDELYRLQEQAQGLGPWQMIQHDHESFLWTGPGGALVVCSRKPLLP